MNSRQRICVVLTDVAILAELSISIYASNGDPENFTLLFFKYFMSMLLPTLILAKVVVKRLGSKELPDSQHSLACDQVEG